MPGGCRKSKQTSWGEGHSLPRGTGGETVLRGAEKAHRRPWSHRKAWDAPHLGAKTWQWGAPTAPQGWPHVGGGA